VEKAVNSDCDKGKIMKITDYKDKHKGETCYILANGPSLNDVDLGLLKNKITFGTNRIYLSEFTSTYYVSVNPLIIEQFWDEIKDLDSTMFLPVQTDVDREFVPVDTRLGVACFSNPEGPIWEGHTVTFVCLQLAYYMGFDRVVLLGLDHYYGDDTSNPNKEEIREGADEYHFHPDYFGKGVKWNRPDLKMSEIAYSLAMSAYSKAGRVIVNASTQSKCTIFPQIPFGQIMDRSPYRVSALVSAYYAQDYLSGNIQDLLNQTEKTEIIVVCQKGSKEHLIASGFDSDQLVIITTEDIPTVYHAWNLAAKAAHGRYLTNANCDDRRFSMAYEIMADILDGRLDIDLIYPDVFITWDEPQTFEDFVIETNNKELVPGRWQGKPGFYSWPEYSRSKLGNGCFMGPMPMWRASLHQEHGWFIDEWVSSGDYEFWLRCSKSSNYLHFPGVLGVYCAREDGIELGHPIEAEQESFWAKSMHQYHGEVSFTPLESSVLIQMGEEYSYVHYEHFDNLVGIIQERNKNASGT
jgi:hypothetical protein